METNLEDEPPYTYLIASFDNSQEANDFVASLNQGPFDPNNLLNQWVVRELTETCRIHNESDHHPIETCVDEYDCAEQLECLEG